LLRGINQFLDLSNLRAYLAPFYSHTARPSIDPELMIRMLIVGYCTRWAQDLRLLKHPRVHVCVFSPGQPFSHFNSH